MDEKNERQLRRRAVRLHMAGHSLRVIGRQLGRSQQWVAKWLRQFHQHGSAGLRSQSRRPDQHPATTPAWVAGQVQRLRHELAQAPIGLIGAGAIQCAWRQQQLPGPAPSQATIKRILQRAGITGPVPPRPAPYFPAPKPTAAHPLQAMDWTERYLERGVKVYAFHTLDLASRAAKQTISPNKTGATVRQHALSSWQRLGIPAFLQLDNDAAFNGGYKVLRVMGQFVRLCLYVGVELIFLPVAEAQRNGAVEAFNRLWSHSFYKRNRFDSFQAVQAMSPAFEHWYMHDYRPPTLNDLSPAQAAALRPARRLTDEQCQAIPDKLPITAGRIHFLRPVSAEGTIRLLNETWRVDKRLTGQYVWATVSTHQRSLSIFHRRAATKPVRLVRVHAYPLSEAAVPIRPIFQTGRRRPVSTML